MSHPPAYLRLYVAPTTGATPPSRLARLHRLATSVAPKNRTVKRTINRFPLTHPRPSPHIALMPPPRLPIPFPAPRRYSGAHLWWHDRIIDLMLAHPEWTKKEIAAELHCTPAMIYLITGSDLFRAKWEQRRRQFSEAHDQVLTAGLTKVAELSLDIIAATLEKRRDAVPLPMLTDLADKTLNRLGYGPRPTTPSVQVNVAQQSTVSISSDDLLAARDALRQGERDRLSLRVIENDAVGVGATSVIEPPRRRKSVVASTEDL